MSGQVITLRALCRRLAEHWPLMAGVFLLVLGSVGVWTVATAPRYQGKAVLRIMEQNGESPLAQRRAVLPGGGLLGLGRDELDTEIGILKSRRLAEAVVDSLSLMWELQRPVTSRRAVVELVQAGDPGLEGRIELEPGDGGNYTVWAKKRGAARFSLGTARPGEPLAWGGYRFRLVPFPPDSLPRKVTLKIVRRDLAVRKLLRSVRVRRQEGGSRLVEVSYLHPDRELAAAVVNSLVREYRWYKRTVEHGEAAFRAEELRAQADRYRRELTWAEEALGVFQRIHSLVSPQEQISQEVRRYSEVRIRLDAVEMERRALKEILALVDREAESSERGKEAYRRLMGYPAFLSQQALADLLMSLVSLENERSQWLMRRTEENEDVRRVQVRIHELEAQIRRLGEDYLDNLDAQAEAAQASLQELESRLQGYPSVEVEFLRLRRNRDMLSEAYLMLDREARMAEVEKNLLLEGIRVVDSAFVPHEDDPAYPKVWIQLLLGAGLGAALAVLAALMRGLWDE